MICNRLTSLLFAICGALALQSCSERSTEPATDSPVVSQQWIGFLNEGTTQFPLPGVPQLPQDLGTHSEVRAESFVLQAILQVADKHALPMPELSAGFIAQMDRVALSSTSHEPPTDSAWRYSGIMRSTVFVDTTVIDVARIDAGNSDDPVQKQFAGLSYVEPKQSVQRMALDLAGSTTNESWVGENRMLITQLNDGSDKCNRTYRWETALSAAERVVLDVQMTGCPQVQALGEFNSWGQSSVELTGVLTTNHPGTVQMSTAVEGVAWMRQSWGNIPSSGGAVAIDSLQLRLDDSRWLDVSRSKRRSGRGPRTVSASLRAAGSVAEEIELSWEDSTDSVLSDSGNAYPRSITLRSSDQELSLKISVMNRLAESSDFGSSRLQAPVSVTGTHAGKGFLSFNTLAN